MTSVLYYTKSSVEIKLKNSDIFWNWTIPIIRVRLHQEEEGGRGVGSIKALRLPSCWPRAELILLPLSMLLENLLPSSFCLALLLLLQNGVLDAICGEGRRREKGNHVFSWGSGGKYRKEKDEESYWQKTIDFFIRGEAGRSWNATSCCCCFSSSCCWVCKLWGVHFSNFSNLQSNAITI